MSDLTEKLAAVDAEIAAADAERSAAMPNLSHCGPCSIDGLRCHERLHARSRPHPPSHGPR